MKKKKEEIQEQGTQTSAPEKEAMEAPLRQETEGTQAQDAQAETSKGSMETNDAMERIIDKLGAIEVPMKQWTHLLQMWGQFHSMFQSFIKTRNFSDQQYLMLKELFVHMVNMTEYMEKITGDAKNPWSELVSALDEVKDVGLN